MPREPGEGGVEVLTVNLEAAFLQIGVADVGVIRSDPVDGPASRGNEPHPALGDALLADLEFDVEIGWLRERHPDLSR